MVDAPERIWAYPDRGSQTYGGWDCAGDGGNSKYPRTEYVRADLYTHLQEQLEAVTRERNEAKQAAFLENAERKSAIRIARAAEARAARLEADHKFKLGQRVTKIKGSSWTGHVVGFYSTKLTPIGYAVVSENEPGSVQIYPESALDVKEAG
jgi:hypothetical protein